MRTLLALLIVAAALAGCLDPRTTLTEDLPGLAGPTADEQTGTLALREDAPRERTGTDRGEFYVERTHRIRGTSSLNAMLLALESFNGDLTVEANPGPGFEVVLTLRGTGPNRDEARARLDAIRLDWSHEANGLHYFDAKAVSTLDTPAGQRASIRAIVPSATRLSLDLLTGNGEITAKDLTVAGARLRTANGEIDAALKGRDLLLRTESGEITLDYAPHATANVTLTTGNGAITASLRESEDIGYDVSATTSNGEAAIALEGAVAGSAGGQGTATARTPGFDQRPIQVRLTATTANGEVAITGG